MSTAAPTVGEYFSVSMEGDRTQLIGGDRPCWSSSVRRATSSRLKWRELSGADTLASPQLPGFSLALGTLFES